MIKVIVLKRVNCQVDELAVVFVDWKLRVECRLHCLQDRVCKLTRILLVTGFVCIFKRLKAATLFNLTEFLQGHRATGRNVRVHLRGLFSAGLVQNLLPWQRAADHVVASDYLLLDNPLVAQLVVEVRGTCLPNLCSI